MQLWIEGSKEQRAVMAGGCLPMPFPQVGVSWNLASSPLMCTMTTVILLISPIDNDLLIAESYSFFLLSSSQELSLIVQDDPWLQE